MERKSIMKKRFLSIILVGVCIAALAGCASESTNENTDVKVDVIADETQEIADDEENIEDIVKPEEDISAEDPAEETLEPEDEIVESEESNVLAEQDETKQPEQSFGTKNDTDNVISACSPEGTQQNQSSASKPAEKTETTKEPAITTAPSVPTTPTLTPAQTPTPAPVVKECEKSGNGKHQFVAEYKKPNCNNEGSNYEICSWCGLIRNETSIPKTEHEYYDWFYTTPTCDSNGWLCHTCKNCTEGGWGEAVPAYGHKWENVVTHEGDCCNSKVTVPTCTVCGLTESEIYGDKQYDKHIGERLQGSVEEFNEETLEFETIHFEYCSACKRNM